MDQPMPQTTPPAPKPTTLPVILSVVLCISLAGIGLLSYQNLSLKNQLSLLKTDSPSQPTSVSPEPTAEADDLYREPNGSAATANWKTYTNEKYQYSFKYPYSLEQKTTITDPGGEYTEYRLETPYKGYRISVFSYYANTPNRRPAFKIGDILLKTISEEEVQIADQHTKKVTDSEDTMIQIGPVTYGTSYHFIVLTSFQRHNGEEEFDQILSTFKFVDQTVDTSNWKVYEQEGWGLSFRYPKGWKMYVDGEGGITYINPSGKITDKEGIQINRGPLSIDDAQILSTSITMDGVKVEKIVYQRQDKKIVQLRPLTSSNQYQSSDGKQHTLYWITYNIDDSLNYLNTVDQILSSFKFLN